MTMTKNQPPIPASRRAPSPGGLLRTLLGLLLLALASLASVSHAATVTYYHPDALGSPVAATDEAGKVLWREAYRPYGTRLRRENTDGNTVWFSGKPTDERYGLSYFGARWYSPAIGRFMSLDPMGVKAGDIHSFNRYAYANNNPYRFIDPDGMAPTPTPEELINQLRANGGHLGSSAKLAKGAHAVAEGGYVAGEVISDTATPGPELLIAPVAAGVKTLKVGKAIYGVVKKVRKELPALDLTGKVHGELLSPKDLKNYSREELSQLKGELEKSVQQRIKKNIELGSDKAHGQRQAAEQQLIKSIDKHLSN